LGGSLSAEGQRLKLTRSDHINASKTLSIQERSAPYCCFSTNVTFSAISATLLAILAAIISKGDTPFTAAGTGGVFFATDETAEIFLPLFVEPAIVRTRFGDGSDDVRLATMDAILGIQIALFLTIEEMKMQALMMRRV
jgi:hypothetical protein